MWPWEHVLFAFLVYSLSRRGLRRPPPNDGAVAMLVLGSLLPDLVDKPLAWQFTLVGSGYSVAHSVFVAVPVCLLVYGLALRRGSPELGAGFAAGYLLHLVGDVIPISLRRGELVYAHLLWPVMRTDGPVRSGSVLEVSTVMLRSYVREITSLEPSLVVGLQLSVVGLGLVLWMADGRPGPPWVLERLQTQYRRLPGRYRE